MGQLFFDPKQEESSSDDQKGYNLMRLSFSGSVIAFSCYPAHRLVKKSVQIRSTCSYGFLVVDDEKQEARIYG